MRTLNMQKLFKQSYWMFHTLSLFYISQKLLNHDSYNSSYYSGKKSRTRRSMHRKILRTELSQYLNLVFCPSNETISSKKEKSRTKHGTCVQKTSTLCLQLFCIYRWIEIYIYEPRDRKFFWCSLWILYIWVIPP